MRALEPVQAGFITRDGVRVGYEVFGTGEPTILLLPTWSLVHSRFWKGQVPYLARHFRVVTYDARGNGRSDRPATAAAYADAEFVADALAVLDAAATPRAVLVGSSLGGRYALHLAAAHPDRVLGVVFVGPLSPLGEPAPGRQAFPFDAVLATDEGWAKFNRHYWRRDYPGFAAFFCAQCFSEPHSTKPTEDCVGWALETTPETLTLTVEAPGLADPAEARALAAQVRCPTLVIQGTDDRIIALNQGEALAEALGADFVRCEGSGHAPQARDPVRFNLLVRDFIERAQPPPPRPRRWVRARSRRRRALFVSSPIGLGHARRDVAIATALRQLRPELEIVWLAQHPVTEVLLAQGEQIHPASAFLASESRHFEAEAGEHTLHAFQAHRRMDEILLANFMVFHDVVQEEDFDLWIGDEAWEVDYYLHENPEEKRAAYAWLTDVVGFVPMPSGGAHEAELTTDYNAEMLGQVARFPRVRDRAIFIGDPEDIVPGRFGPDLPLIREWTEQHYAFCGYIPGFDPATVADRASLRAALGYTADERVCLVTVGGSGVGDHLLRRVLAAVPTARERIPALRVVVVAGPRIDPASLPSVAGVEVRGYVHDLYRHLAACDLAVVQGGLTTTMELVAAKRPFLFVPLRDHFEQTVHVRHRLDRYGAGRALDFAEASPEVLAAAMAEEIDRPVAYRDVPRDGARRAASLIAELI
jgi:pimeloyl-ACP methyl ester carboxylesterase/predicted glycosyltransferase